MRMRDGILQKNRADRWEITYEGVPERDQLTCGTICEIQVGNDWVRTRIEHDGEGYYAVKPKLRLLGGMKARLPS